MGAALARDWGGRVRVGNHPMVGFPDLEHPESSPVVGDTSKKRILIMLWTIAVILLVLWALGMVSSYTIGGLIHILLVVAVVMVLIRLIQGRRVI